MHPEEVNIAAIMNFNRPKPRHRSAHFKHYWFIHLWQHLSQTSLTSLSRPRTPDCTRAFEWLKQVLCLKLVLVSPGFTKTFILPRDASDRGIGAVLSQLNEDFSVAYNSQKLRTENSTVEKECLAIKLAVKAFHTYLTGPVHLLSIQTIGPYNG